MSVLSLGLNCAHDNAACVVGKDGILVAVREERISRKKYDDGVPENAIEYCMEAVGVENINQFDSVTVNQYPLYDCDQQLRRLGYERDIFIGESHHLLHAYYCMHVLGNQDAVILVLDGSGYSYASYIRSGASYLGDAPAQGDMEEAETAFLYKNGKLSLLRKNWGVWHALKPYFRFESLGHMYACASQYIFNRSKSWVHAGKVMGLASYGDHTELPLSMVSWKNGLLKIDTNWVHELPLAQSYSEPMDEVPLLRDLAARAQHELERGVLEIVSSLMHETGQHVLCYSGGVALNSVANGKIRHIRGVDELVITPAADDAGVAIGAALYGYERKARHLPDVRYNGDFHGKTYSAQSIKEAVSGHPFAHCEMLSDRERFVSVAAEALQAGEIIGFFEGRSEFGPRALGHRSILANPAQRDIKRVLNARVKFRESFRPYAACILSERVQDYFDFTGENPYMLIVARLLEGRSSEIPGVCHVDGTCRIQTISADYSGLLRKLIEKLDEVTGTPLVLNTSFNIKDEPIVETPNDAVECFMATDLDALYIYPYVVTKRRISKVPDDPPYNERGASINAGIELRLEHAQSYEGWHMPRYSARLRTGKDVELSFDQYRILLALCDNLSLMDVADRLQFSKGYITKITAELERSGLVCTGRLKSN